MRTIRIPMPVFWLLAVGCATTRFTDTPRSATEQLLLSEAVETALSSIDLSAVAGRAVFLDVRHLANVADKEYVEVAVRRRLARRGVRFSSTEEESEVVVKVGVGTLGTNRSDSLVGIPQTAVPVGVVPATIPELAIVKETKQLGAAKLFVFAYERATGALLTDGTSPIVTTDYRAKWILGSGPHESGTAAIAAPNDEASAFKGTVEPLNLLPWFDEPGSHQPGHSIVESPFTGPAQDAVPWHEHHTP